MTNDSPTRITVSYSGLLIALGVMGYLFTGRQSITALIPAFFAIVVLIVLVLLRRLARPPVIAWVLMAVAAVGFIATVAGVPKTFALITGGTVARPAAAVSQTIMAILSAAYIAIILVKGMRHGSARPQGD